MNLKYENERGMTFLNIHTHSYIHSILGEAKNVLGNERRLIDFLNRAPPGLKQQYLISSLLLTYNYETRLDKNAKPREPPYLDPSKSNFKWTPRQKGENISKM